MKFNRWMPRITLFALCTAALWVAAPVHAEADYRGLDMAVTNFFTHLDKLVVEVPRVITVEGAAQALDTWTAANNAVADAGQAIVHANPSFETNPPPRFTQYFRRCTSLTINYTPVTAGIGKLIRQYRQDPKFAAAVGRHQQSLIRMDGLLKLGVVDHD